MFDSRAIQEMPQMAVGSSRRQSLTERLTDERDRLKERLAQLDTSIAALQKNPEIQEVFDIVSRLV